MSLDFIGPLITIIVIDLVLAGDNAIIIGLAAKDLPSEQRKRVIYLGTIGAILIRIIATLAVVWLLSIPGLQIVGGIILVYISYRLLVHEKEHKVSPKKSFRDAILTIILADTIMSLDNVLAVAGAAKHNYILVVIGIIITIPIIVWGSTIFVSLLKKYPVIIYVGAGVLSFTGFSMIFEDNIVISYIKNFFWIEYAITLPMTLVVLIIGGYRGKKS